MKTIKPQKNQSTIITSLIVLLLFNSICYSQSKNFRSNIYQDDVKSPNEISDFKNKSSFLAELKKVNLWKSLFGNEGCPEVFEHLPEQDAQLLINKAFELRVKEKDCESARYFYELRRQWPTKEYYRLAWIELINSYLLAEDHIATINEANDFLRDYKNTEDAEEIHLKLINAVNILMIKSGTDKDQKWTEFVLGISKDQNSENPYLQNLSFKSFIDQHPKSKYLNLINDMVTSARNNYSEYHFKIGLYYSIRIDPSSGVPNYPAAIMRYQVALNYGPLVKVFPEAVYETMKAYSKILLHIDTLSDDSLMEWMHLNSFSKEVMSRKNVLLNRTQIKTTIRTQMDNLFSELNKRLPENYWTLESRKLIETTRPR